MITKPEIGDIIYIKPNAKLRCWVSGCNYVTKITRGNASKGNFWITCYNPSITNGRRADSYLKAGHYEFLVYWKQFIRSVNVGTILIFKKKVFIA